MLEGMEPTDGIGEPRAPAAPATPVSRGLMPVTLARGRGLADVGSQPRSDPRSGGPGRRASGRFARGGLGLWRLRDSQNPRAGASGSEGPLAAGV